MFYYNFAIIVNLYDFIMAFQFQPNSFGFHCARVAGCGLICCTVRSIISLFVMVEMKKSSLWYVSYINCSLQNNGIDMLYYWYLLLCLVHSHENNLFVFHILLRVDLHHKNKYEM